MHRNARFWIAAILITNTTLCSAQLRIPILEPKAPSCAYSQAVLSDDWESISKVALSSEAQDVPQLQFLTAGASIAIRLSSDPTPSATSSLRLSVFEKPFGNWDFSTVCQNFSLSRGASSTLVVASRPGQSNGSVWRVEISRSRSGPRPSIANVTLLRPRSSNRFSDEPQINETIAEASAFLCAKTAGGPILSRNTAGFGGRTRLDIELTESDLSISKEQRKEVARTLLTAASLWVEACVGCSIDHLSVIQVDSKTFVRHGLTTWYRQHFVESKSSDPDTLEKDLRHSLEPTDWLLAGDWPQPALPNKELTDYDLVESDDLQALCRSSVPGDRSPTVALVQSAICHADQLPASARARLLIRFAMGHTACGNDQNVIGCRADDQLTEYNVRDYQFGLGAIDSAIPSIGSGPVNVSLLHVLLHEMGHWIGLPDLPGTETVMASSLQFSRCINDRTITALARHLKSEGRGRNLGTAPLSFTYRSARRPTQVREASECRSANVCRHR